MIVWIDEAGFYLLAGTVRNSAPRGQTPILRVPLTRDHLSVLSAITAQSRLLVAVQARVGIPHRVARCHQAARGPRAAPAPGDRVP